MGELRTSAPRRTEGDETVTVVVDVAASTMNRPWFADTLWFTVAVPHAALLADRADHVAVALLLPAMKAGVDLRIGGVLTDVLLHQLNGDLQSLLLVIRPELTRVHVSADESAPSAPTAAGVGAGFSGGVDSLSIVQDYLLDPEAPATLRLTHLLNYDVGSHGHGADGAALWHTRSQRLELPAATWGVPLVTVGSNLDAHYPRIGFLESVSMRNAAVPHLLSAGIGRVLVASSQTFTFAGIDGDGDISRSDPMLLPLLSTPALTQTAAHWGRTRVEKTLRLIGRPEAQYLDVCVRDVEGTPHNCGACPKCLRTLVTIEIAGHLDEFCPSVFRLAPYLAARNRYLGELLARDTDFTRTLRTLAAERGWRWGFAARTRAVAVRARRLGRRLAHRGAATRVGRRVRRVLGR